MHAALVDGLNNTVLYIVALFGLAAQLALAAARARNSALSGTTVLLGNAGGAIAIVALMLAGYRVGNDAGGPTTAAIVGICAGVVMLAAIGIGSLCIKSYIKGRAA